MKDIAYTEYNEKFSKRSLCNAFLASVCLISTLKCRAVKWFQHYNITALANLVWAVLHILLQQCNHNIVNKQTNKKKSYQWINEWTKKHECAGTWERQWEKNIYGTSKTSGPQTNIYFRWLSVSSSERENEAKREKSHQVTLVHYFCQWLCLLFCYYNEYHCLFFS